MSTGEAGYYALVKAASVSLGMKARMADLGVQVRIRLLTDASTGKAIAARRGLGKIRHLDVAQLWVQQMVNDGTLQVIKIKNDFNSADLFTKHLDRTTMDKCLELLGHQILRWQK